MIFFLMISEPHKTKRTDMTFPYPKLCRSYVGRDIFELQIDEQQSIIRDIPKPVIARINGFAIGGGNVFATLCDLSIMADTAKLGQVGPKVGSVDAGWGTAFLARHVGDKKAREIWYLNQIGRAHV